MSHNVNTELIERAVELSEECTNSVLGGQLDYAIKRSDMEHLYALVQAAERHLNFMDLLQDEVQ